MMENANEDECNYTYGKVRMYQALQLKHSNYDLNIPSERTVYRIIQDIVISHHARKHNGMTPADRLTRKSEDLFKRDFTSDGPSQKAVTDITEIKASDRKLYVSVLFGCFYLLALGIAIDDNMKAG